MGRRTAAAGDSAPAGGIVHAGCAPHFLFETSKRKCAAPGGKEKMFGGSVCASADLLPPAGDGWRSRAAVRDGNALPLGRPLARGSQGYILRRFSLPLTLPRRTSQRVAKRDARKEELVKCVLAPRRPPHPPPRDGSCNLAEESGVPDGQLKSALAPIRRPPSRGGPLHRSAPKRPFLLDRARPVFFSARRKRKWGVHPAEQAPCGSKDSRGRRTAAFYNSRRSDRPAR